MELREFAEQVLFAKTLPEKLAAPAVITDDRPGAPLPAPEAPGRPPELLFKSQHSGKSSPPRIHALDHSGERGRLLHFFANHELLATELMALALLRFPNAPAAFRRAVLQTLKDEQEHTRCYLQRMQACGIGFGEMPVSGYFWRSISPMDSPLDYVAGLSLTFEQANLDFARFFAHGFAEAGDLDSSRLLERIYRDEIGHVAVGLKWFRRWKAPDQDDWDAFRTQLKFPLSAQRAKGPGFNEEGRLAAGFDRRFIEELKVYSQSKGRTPGVFVFNPFAEGRIARGKTFSPNKHQQELHRDLENLPQFLCRQDDVVLVARRPSAAFLASINDAGYAVPEFVELSSGRIDRAGDLCRRKIGRLSPWAWGPDSQELLRPLFPNLPRGSEDAEHYYTQEMASLYSKEWSAKLLERIMAGCEDSRSEASDASPRGSAAGLEPAEPLLCGLEEVGVAASSLSEVLAQIAAIRQRGHHAVVLKEALGVAGHNAIRFLEPELLDSQRRWIASAFEHGGRLVVEPWLQREVDFSVQLEMTRDGLKLIGYTGLSNDWRGQFQGNWAWPDFGRYIPIDLAQWFPGVRDISVRVRKVYGEIRRILEPELRQSGYHGPVGLDAFIYRTSRGSFRLKPIVEINPRYTMGRLTLELMENVAPGSTGALRLLNRQQLESDGFKDFSAWARSNRERAPLRFEGDPVPKIREGTLCLSDPDRAQVCLATFEVRT